MEITGINIEWHKCGPFQRSKVSVVGGNVSKNRTQMDIAVDVSWSETEQKVLPIFAQLPVGRVGTLGDIPDAIAYLVSPRASYITGANVRRDGGIWSAC